MKDHRRALLQNVLHSKALTESQADSEIRRETEELMAAKKRRKEEEKKMEESKKTLLEKHNEMVREIGNFLLCF